MKNAPILSDASGARAPPLGQVGSLEARLASSEWEIRQAQKIRYKVFYEELSASPSLPAKRARRDLDAFDPLCDHLIIVDQDASRPQTERGRVVGTYRLLRQEVAEGHQGFYSSGEFEVSELVRRNAPLRFLELGRSCVLPDYRRKPTLELLWHAIWRYSLVNDVEVLFGCASLQGTDPERLALPLSFLHHSASAPPPWHVRAIPARRIEMNRMEAERIDSRLALRALPPLVRGYLKLGAYFGDGAVADERFKTIDVFTVLPVSRISERYIAYFGPGAERHACP